MLECRPELAALSPAAHGALDFAELEQLGLRPDEVLDFSVNSNPFGPPPVVRQVMEQTAIERYPDRETLALRRALAGHLGVDSTRILAGNGTAELIWLVALAYIRPGDAVLVAGPTFGEYARAARIMGAEVHTWTAQPETGFTFNTTQISQALHRCFYKIVFLCNPNNPTGQVFPLEALDQWAQAHPQTLFVVDEAYIAFAAGVESVIRVQADNILVLRSMTKDYALAGLRLGYAVGDEAIISALIKVRPPWSVNALAQAAGVAVLQDRVFLNDSMRKLHIAKQTLIDGLMELGYRPLDSKVHYFLTPVGNGADFRQALLSFGIQVRDCSSFGLPAYVRISPRQPEENASLLYALQELKR